MVFVRYTIRMGAARNLTRRGSRKIWTDCIIKKMYIYIQKKSAAWFGELTYRKSPLGDIFIFCGYRVHFSRFLLIDAWSSIVTNYIFNCPNIKCQIWVKFPPFPAPRISCCLFNISLELLFYYTEHSLVLLPDKVPKIFVISIFLKQTRNFSVSYKLTP